MEAGAWGAWRIDVMTVGWIVWLAFFAVWEGVAVISSAPQDTLTYHLRPLFGEHPLTWFVAVGLWMWAGFHFLVEGIFFPAASTT